MKHLAFCRSITDRYVLRVCPSIDLVVMLYDHLLRHDKYDPPTNRWFSNMLDIYYRIMLLITVTVMNFSSILNYFLTRFYVLVKSLCRSSSLATRC